MEKRRNKHGKFFWLSLQFGKRIYTTLRTSFKKYFDPAQQRKNPRAKKKELKEQYINVQKRDITQYWTKLRRQIAKRGGISYPELKALDVFEFFVTLAAFEEEIAAEMKAHKKLLNKSKIKKRRR